MDETIPDPNAGTMYHAPTGNRVDTSGGVEEGMSKRNYGKSFERPPFDGTIDGEVFDRFEQTKY